MSTQCADGSREREANRQEIEEVARVESRVERQTRETTNDSSVFFIDDVYVYIQWEGMQSKRHNC
jgi:hypothetical protein